MSIESLVADFSKSGDYVVVAFGDAVVLVSGGGAIVNNIAVAVFGEEVYRAVPPSVGPLGASGADIGLIGDAVVDDIAVATFGEEVY